MAIKPAFQVQFGEQRWTQGEDTGRLLGVSVSVEMDSLPRFSHYGFSTVTTAIADSKLLEEHPFYPPRDRLFRSRPEDDYEEILRRSFEVDEQYPEVLNQLSGTIDFVFIDDIVTVSLNPFAGLDARTNNDAQKELGLIGIEVSPDFVEVISHHDFEFVSEYRLVDSTGILLHGGSSEGRSKNRYSISFPGTNTIPDGARIEFDLPRKRNQTTIPFVFEDVPIAFD